MSVRIVFMGTPDFAVASLQELVESGVTIAGVVTAPDRPSGRGQILSSPPVKIYAESKGIPVLQPTNLKDPSFIIDLKALSADIFVVVAFRMLPGDVWKIPPLGTFNLHASLLPQYRGAAPINRALIEGEKETGVTTFLIDDNIDTGNIILQEKTPVTYEMNAGELHDILMAMGAKLVVKTVKLLSEGKHEPLNQDQLIKPGKILKTAPKLFKPDCRINWELPSGQIHNFIRGLSPYPGAWTIITNEDGEELSLRILEAAEAGDTDSLSNGRIMVRGRDEILIGSGQGSIQLKRIQPEGKRAMTVREFLIGYRKVLIKAT